MKIAQRPLGLVVFFFIKKKHSVRLTILITFSKFGMTETVSERLKAARPTGVNEPKFRDIQSDKTI